MDDFTKQVAEIAGPFYTAITSFVMAFLMALFRTAKKHGQADWLEAFMCGFFAVGFWSLTTWLGFPEIISVGFASVIGYKGTHFVSKKIDKVSEHEINQ